MVIMIDDQYFSLNTNQVSSSECKFRGIFLHFGIQHIFNSLKKVIAN